jgi:iron uptake system component EfeO
MPGRAQGPGAVLAVLAVLLAGALACGCGQSAAAEGHTDRSLRSGPTLPGPDPPPTRAEGVAAQAAVDTFRADINRAASAFVSDVDRLQASVDGRAVAEARTDELAAQSDYDRFRALESDDQVTAATLDELAGDVGAHQSFGGLHAVERDLWTSGDASGDITGLVAQAPVAQYLLAKEVLAPEAIASTGVDELSWVNDTAVPGREELYSRHDAVDIVATVGAAHEAFVSVEPLGHLVAPSLTASVDQLFARLLDTVRSLGDPAQVADQDISTAFRLSLSQQVDATAAPLSQLAAALVPFGTTGPSS